MVDILVTGKKISDMDLVTEVKGDEKIPTDAVGDLAISPDQLVEYVRNSSNTSWGKIVGDIDSQTDLKNKFSSVNQTISSHVNNTGNPHNVTKNQIGLNNVDNTSDLNKPVSTATKALLDSNLNYIKENGAALPFSDSVDYQEGALVLKDGELVQKAGNAWIPVKVVSHNTLTERNSINSHPSIAISYGSITQEKYNSGLDHISQILSIESPFDGMRVYVKSYHEGFQNLGVFYQFDSSKPKSSHNGGTVIDKDRIFPSNWDNQTEISSWFSSSPSGNGCWVLDGNLDVVDVRLFGARGGASNDTKSIQMADTLGRPIGVYDSTYYSTYKPINKIVGDGFLKYDQTYVQENSENLFYGLNSVPQGDHMKLIFLGDSITFGYGINEFSNTYTYQIQKYISTFTQKSSTFSPSGSTILSKVSNLNGVTAGTSGITKNSKIISSGGYLEFSDVSGTLVGVRVNGGNTTGNILVKIDGELVGTILTSDATGNNDLVYDNLSRRPFLNSTLRLEATGGSVDLNSLCIFPNRDRNVEVYTYAESGYSTQDFIETKSILHDELAGPLYQHVCVIALGTNDIFNPSKAVPSAVYKENLESMILELYGVANVVLTVPLAPVEVVYPAVLEPFQNYVKAVRELAHQYCLKLVDLTEIAPFATHSGPSSLRLYQADGLHPNEFGNRLIAKKYIDEVVGTYLDIEAVESKVLINLNNPVTHASGDYRRLSATKEKGKIHLSGGIELNGAAPSSVIANFSEDAIPIGKSVVFTASGFDGSLVISQVLLKLDTNGNLEYLGFNGNSAPAYIFFDGISYLI